MQQNKRIKVLSGLALGGALVLTVALIGPKVNTNIINTFSTKGIGNVLTIDKNSVCDTAKSKVTGKTEKGNSVQFSYSRFDTRPEGDPASHNQLVCFAKVADGLGGYIKNDTAFYSVENIKIYSWSTTNPNPSTLSTSKFNLYYGFEPISVDHSNTARVEVTNGQYTFEAGFEPSYIALEAINSEIYDTLVSKIEISYKCEPVSGTIEEKPQPAYKYDYVGKEFTTSSGKKIPYNITKEAPWVSYPLTKLVNKNIGGANAGYDETFTVTEESAIFKGYYDGGFIANIGCESVGRNILSITLKPGSWKWGGPAFYMHVKDSSGTSLLSASENHIYNNDGVNAWRNQGGHIFDESGNEVTGSISANTTYTFEKDFTSALNGKSIGYIDVWSDWSIADGPDYANAQTLIIKDITFKATICGHSLSDIVEETHNKAYQYEFEGTLTKCGICGEIIDDSGVVAQAPWAHADIFDDTGSNFSMSATKSSYNPSNNTWSTNKDDYLEIYPLNGTVFTESTGRKLITATIVYDIVSGWGGPNGDLYFGVNHGLGTNKSTRIYSALPLKGTQSWEDYSIAVSLTNAETGADMTGINMKGIKVNYTIDVSSVSEIYNIWFGTSLSTVTLKIEDITFKEPCQHENVESFNEPMNCGTKCSKCGAITNSFVTSISMAYGSKQDKFTLTENVTFDSKTCAAIETLENINDAAGGYAENYKVKFNGLISKMKAERKTKVSFDFYLKNGSNFNTRFYWGVGNNKDYAWADHYNAITSIAGGKIAAGTFLTQLGSKGCGDAHAEGRGFYCNDWYRLTVDLSDSTFATYEDYFFFSAVCGSGPTYDGTILYITNMSVAD